MIYGTDESKYQSLEALAERIAVGFFSFVILNVDDPGFTAKAQLCEANRYCWGVYVYMLPGVSGDYDFDKMHGRSAWIGTARAGFWFDYEEAGVEPWQLDRGFQRADELGFVDRVGYYASNGALDHGPYLGRRYWLAQYPGNNDGSFPGMTYQASRPVDLWQYTSGANDPAGGLDRNVVVDEAWWAALTGGTTPTSGGTDVIYEATSDATNNPAVTTGTRWLDAGTRFLRGEGITGIPIVPKPGDEIGTLSIEKQTLLDAARSQLGGDAPPPQPCPPGDAGSLSDAELVSELERRLGV